MAARTDALFSPGWCGHQLSLVAYVAGGQQLPWLDVPESHVTTPALAGPVLGVGGAACVGQLAAKREQGAPAQQGAVHIHRDQSNHQFHALQ